MNLEAERIVHLYEVIRKTEQARQASRLWNLRDRRERKAFEAEAYQPHLDYGEAADLKPGYHEENQMGWRE